MADVDALESAPQSREHSRRDRALAALAARQHGVVGQWQLLDLGLGRGAIKHRLATGHLHRLYTGVYAVGHDAIRTEGRLLAAVLAFGSRAVLSHHDSGWLWGLKPPTGSAVHVTVPGCNRHGRPGVVLHRVRRLDPADRTVRHGIPVTTVARTLLDLGEVLRPRQLQRVFEEAERLRLFDLRAIEELCARSAGRRGLRPLRAILDGEVAARPTRSELERRFVALCRGAGLPMPGVNVFVEGFEVDAAWPDRRLVVELDSYAFHRGRAAFEEDRLRDAALQLAGYRVLRVTHRRIAKEPAEVAATVRSLLESLD